MSLFDNPKSSEYFKFNGRLYYLEQMFKKFLKENNATEEDITEIINQGLTIEKVLYDFFISAKGQLMLCNKFKYYTM
jgi:hypothetical protein